MKTAVAIVCSLFLAGTLIVPAAAIPPARAACSARPCCDDCSNCCSARTTPESSPISAAPVPSNFQSQFVVFATAAWLWTLPEAPASAAPLPLLSLTASGSVPLFERDCIRLI